MTPHSYFSSYTILIDNQHITVANGSHTPVTGCGNIQLQSSLHLNNVLHVPKLSNNLLSIYKITQDLNCAVTFSTSIVFSRILPRGGQLELLKSMPGYTTCSMTTEKSVPNKRLSLPIIKQVQNLGHPPKYGFSIGVWVILRLVSLSLCFFFV